MKLLKKAIYLSVMMLFIIQIYNRIIYRHELHVTTIRPFETLANASSEDNASSEEPFELHGTIIHPVEKGFQTNNKIITHQTVEIGEEGESYALPASIGEPGQVLILNEYDELEWGYLPEMINIPTGEQVIYPYMRRGNECPAGTCFLPTRRIKGEDARGYCMATKFSDADPLNCSDAQWAGVFSGPLFVWETFGYCQRNYGEGAVTPTLDFFWPELAYAIEAPQVERGISKEILHFSEEENHSIQIFKDNLTLYRPYFRHNNDCMDRYFPSDQNYKGILTRDISTYGFGSLGATVLFHTYCADRNETTGYPFFIPNRTPVPENPRPYQLAEIPMTTLPHIVSSLSMTRGMSQFRMLCIR